MRRPNLLVQQQWVLTKHQHSKDYHLTLPVNYTLWIKMCQEAVIIALEINLQWKCHLQLGSHCRPCGVINWHNNYRRFKNILIIKSRATRGLRGTPVTHRHKVTEAWMHLPPGRKAGGERHREFTERTNNGERRQKNVCGITFSQERKKKSLAGVKMSFCSEDEEHRVMLAPLAALCLGVLSVMETHIHHLQHP